MLKAKKVPEVSILMPVHGNAPYLENAIKSVENQTFANFEFIIVLDRVGKNVESLLKKRTELNKKIKVVNSKSTGISSALNTGLNHCKAPYVARLDSDDLMQPQRLKVQKLFLDNHEKIDCVGSQIIKINAEGKAIGRSYLPEMPTEISNVLPFRNCIAHPSVMFRKNTIISIGGYRTEFDGCEDYDLWLRMDKGDNLKNLEMMLTSYRIWPKQSKTMLSNDLLSKLKRVRKVQLKNQHVPYQYRSMIWLNLIFKAKNIMFLQTCTSLDLLFLSMKSPRNLSKTISSSFRIFYSCFFVPIKIVKLLCIVAKYGMKYIVTRRAISCK
jgi:glycosyltransferase involved in cell wall biosynthesis